MHTLALCLIIAYHRLEELLSHTCCSVCHAPHWFSADSRIAAQPQPRPSSACQEFDFELLLFNCPRLLRFFVHSIDIYLRISELGRDTKEE